MPTADTDDRLTDARVSEQAVATRSDNRHRTGRVGRKRTERIERLERAAARVFADKGYEGANFEQIAAELDLRGPSLYHYFTSKEELFLRCVNKSAEEVFARLREIAKTDLAPIDKLRSLLREQVLIEVRDYPEFVPLFFKTRIQDPTLRERVLAIRREHSVIFEEIVEQIRAASEVDTTVARVWLETAFGALAHLPEWYNPNGRLGVEALADLQADTLVAPFRRHEQPA
jgi:AcrR family transcriptional regulator